MIVDLTLPRLGETMETGRIAGWLKRPGQAFRRGETLVEIESDKTVVEMPALADGVLVEIVAQAGTDADVGAVLCRYEDGKAAAAPPPPVATAAPAGPLPVVAPPPASAVVAGGGLRATPLARAIARQHGMALADVAGSGRRGRIEAADVRAAGDSAPATRAEVIDVPGGHIAFRNWGTPHATAARVVLLHGLGGDVQAWSTLAAALQRAGRHVTAIDLPGHGATSVAATDIDAAAAAVSAFLDRLGTAAVELVGHSLGAAVAARVARRAPGRVRRLTLLAPAGLDRAIDVAFIRGLAHVRSSGALTHLLRRLAVRPSLPTATQLDALAAELARGRLIALADALVDDGGQQIDITADLRALASALPVRVVWGVQDRIIPWTQVSNAGSRVAIHLIADAGHVPHWDQPAEVAALFD